MLRLAHVNLNDAKKIFEDMMKYIYPYFADFDYCSNALNTTVYPICLDFTLKASKKYYFPLDGQGLPVRNYSSVGRQYNPTRIAAFGLAHYNNYILTKDKNSLSRFLKVAEWFQRSPDGIWRYEFDWGTLKAPWISAMAQGEGISVLTRAWYLTGETIYLERAIAALAPFTKEISQGGVLSKIDGLDPFLEEYPDDKPVHVLNGFLYAVIGMVDLERIAQIDLPLEMSAKDWLSILERHLSKWDLGYWSAYDLSGLNSSLRNASTVSYHRLHIAQLKFLGEWSNSRVLLNTADSWYQYLRKLSNRLKAMSVKVRYRMKVRAQR